MHARARTRAQYTYTLPSVTEFLVLVSLFQMDCSPERRALVRGAVRRINSLKPLPRVAIIMGPLTKSSPGTGAYEASFLGLEVARALLFLCLVGRWGVALKKAAVALYCYWWPHNYYYTHY